MHHRVPRLRSIGSYFFILVISIGACQAQTIQRYMDLGGASYYATDQTSDGGTLVHMLGPTNVLQRFDEQLEPMWVWQMPVTGTCGADVDGGALSLRWVNTDSDTLGMVVDRFDVAGAITWSRSILIPEVPNWPGNVAVKAIQADGLGGIWGSASFYPEGSYIFKLNGGGEALWTRFVPGVFVHDLASDGAGGCYALGERPEEPGFVVVRTDADGNEGFNNHFMFEEVSQERFVVENTGNGVAVIVGHGTGIDLTLIDSAGMPLSMHRYVPVRPVGSIGQFLMAGGHVTSNGEFVFTAGYLGSAAVLFRANASGEVIEGHGFLNSTEPYRSYLFWKTASNGQDLIVFGRSGLPNGNGGHVNVDIVWKLSPPFGDACYAVPFDILTTTVPISSILVEQNSSSTVAQISSSSFQVFLDERSIPTMWDYCDPIILAVEDSPIGLPALFELRGTIHRVGEPIRLKMHASCELRLFDPLGQQLQVVSSNVHEGEAAFNITDHTAGIYLLIGRSAQGRTQSARFVVE